MKSKKLQTCYFFSLSLLQFLERNRFPASDFLFAYKHCRSGNGPLLTLMVFIFISTDEIHNYQDEIDAELQSSRPKLRGVYASYAKEGMEQSRPVGI